MDTYTFRIRDRYRFSKISESKGILASESGVEVLESKTAIQFLEVLQKREAKDVRLEDFGDPVLISQLVVQLERSGVITQDVRALPIPHAGFWESLGFDPLNVARQLSAKPLKVYRTGPSNFEGIDSILTDSGFSIDVDGQIAIVFASDYLDPELEVLNREFFEKKIPWLLICAGRTKPLIGPIFQTSQDSPCWKCLSHRLEMNRQEEFFFSAQTRKGAKILRPEINQPAFLSMAISTAAIELLKWLVLEQETPLFQNVLELSPFDGERTLHRVIKRPQCKCCGNGWHKILKPFKIKKKSVESNAGGYRSEKPEITFKKFKHHISPISGVVPYVRPYYAIQNAPIFNQVSGNNLALRSKSSFWLNMHLRSTNGGKGKSEIQAKTGALCEAIERYSLMYHGQSDFITAAYDDLEDAIHPNDCMLYSDAQIESREVVNAQAAKFYSLVPIRFATKKEMGWTPVYSLTNEKFKYLPSCYCYAQYPAEDETKLFSYPDSNGCAAGNTIEEAILQGFLELVERDAAAIWWYNQLSRPGVDLRSANNPYIDRMVEYYAEIGRSLYALDLTTDLGIPVFAVISHHLEPNENDRILYAFGAHLEAGIALERAIVEQNQLLPIARIDKVEDPVMQKWLDTANLGNQKCLNPSPEAKRNIQTDYPGLCPPTIHDSIQFCLQTTEKTGLETLVLDLTQPDICMPVVKVMVPGLRHMWRRTAPGRLFDVPVKMGWLDSPLTEEELNPISIFI